MTGVQSLVLAARATRQQTVQTEISIRSILHNDNKNSAICHSCMLFLLQACHVNEYTIDKHECGIYDVTKLNYN